MKTAWSGTIHTPDGEKNGMNIPMMLNHITDEICENYCKYQAMMLSSNPGEDPDMLEEMLYEQYCANCPLMLI